MLKVLPPMKLEKKLSHSEKNKTNFQLGRLTSGNKRLHLMDTDTVREINQGCSEIKNVCYFKTRGS